MKLLKIQLDYSSIEIMVTCIDDAKLKMKHYASLGFKIRGFSVE